MRILLTGCNGQVGWELARALPALGELIALLGEVFPDWRMRLERSMKAWTQA